MIVIDTATLIDIEQNTLPDQAEQQLRGETIAITSLSHAEYWYGLLPNPNVELTTRLDAYKVLQTTTRSAELFAEHKQRLHAQGNPIPDFDLFIAAITQAHNAPLLTADNHFQAVKGLTTITNTP